jgi:hypothetical protein
MILLDEHNDPIILDNIDIPFPVSHFWALDLEIMDFTLRELVLNEELEGAKTLRISIHGYSIEAPADWNILIYSPETSELDVVEFSDLTKHTFSAFVYNHKTEKLVPNVVRVINYDPYTNVQTPSLIKNTMLCHPLGCDMWACIAPTDSYNKYLKDMVIGDLI